MQAPHSVSKHGHEIRWQAKTEEECALMQQVFNEMFDGMSAAKFLICYPKQHNQYNNPILLLPRLTLLHNTMSI
jgi:hypothetical protein